MTVSEGHPSNQLLGCTQTFFSPVPTIFPHSKLLTTQSLIAFLHPEREVLASIYSLNKTRKK